MKLLTVLLAVLLAACATANAQVVLNDLSSQPEGRIYFNSLSPKNKFQLVHRKYDTRPTMVSGVLTMPPGAKGRVPAMIIAHGSSGITPKLFERWTKLFNDMGMAAFVVDSFSGRGIVSTMNDQNQVGVSVHEADALMALRLLATDPRIDASRIGLIGFSRGGKVAMEMVMESFRKGIIDDDLKFAALVSFYPGCTQVWWEKPAPALTGTPLMMALGAKDDYTPARQCQDFVPIMERDGQSVELHVYPDSYHNFDDSQTHFGYHAAATTPRHCTPSMLDMKNDAYYRLDTGERYPDSRVIQAEFKHCLERGVSTGANPSQGRRAVEDVRRFLAAAFHLG
ncbi:dienelactone hydrolase family protein [Herbaspirillum sp. alder98]|uniref:dienelactone hydrolase family protein n=1 Tax=Herbaspirillum sp. alder98 TaxID=2913096 RepID=UPI001CD823A5|nr:dienelactone hydrolase family protein [Herbaspirillum sp. alder98]MCA1323738.1 dienelactone hydrolase family protein [Herbaspirillum sp. alder98]